MSKSSDKPLAGIIMGSKSDREVMQAASAVFTEFGVAHESRAISAHRLPELVADDVNLAKGREPEVSIAAVRMAALPGLRTRPSCRCGFWPIHGPSYGKSCGGITPGWQSRLHRIASRREPWTARL